jgi:hypothetical protein
MNAGKLLAIGAAITAALAVATSIWLNPPAENRARALDVERSSRINILQAAVTGYFTKHQTLPKDLDALNEIKNLASTQWNLQDPATGEPFGYEIVDEKNYRLCANFERPSDGRPLNPAFIHKSGRDCVEYQVK